MERDPLPDARPWRDIEERHERLRTGLAALYAWYGRNANLAGCVLRDGEFHPLTREVAELRMGPPMVAIREALSEKLNARQRVLLSLALSFFTWRSLVRDGGLTPGAAVKEMVHTIDGASKL